MHWIHALGQVQARRTQLLTVSAEGARGQKSGQGDSRPCTPSGARVSSAAGQCTCLQMQTVSLADAAAPLTSNLGTFCFPMALIKFNPPMCRHSTAAASPIRSQLAAPTTHTQPHGCHPSTRSFSASTANLLPVRQIYCLLLLPRRLAPKSVKLLRCCLPPVRCEGSALAPAIRRCPGQSCRVTALRRLQRPPQQPAAELPAPLPPLPPALPAPLLPPALPAPLLPPWLPVRTADHELLPILYELKIR